MYRTGSHLNAFDALASYNYQLGKQLRIGAVTALKYAVFNHYVPMCKPLLMVVLPKGEKMLLWMKSDAYDMTLRTFSTTAFAALDVYKRDSESGTLLPPLSLKNMPRMMSHPIFQCADKAIGILTEIKDRDGKNICVAIDLDRENQGGGETLKMKDIPGINGRERSDIVYPILTYFCKLQVLVMLQA